MKTYKPFLAILAAIAVAVSATSCQSLAALLGNRDAAYTAACELFAATVQSAADARDLGLLDADKLNRIDANIQSGQRILNEWKAALDSGGDAEAYRLLLLATIRQINEYLGGSN